MGFDDLNGSVVYCLAFRVFALCNINQETNVFKANENIIKLQAEK